MKEEDILKLSGEIKCKLENGEATVEYHGERHVLFGLVGALICHLAEDRGMSAVEYAAHLMRAAMTLPVERPDVAIKEEDE